MEYFEFTPRLPDPRIVLEPAELPVFEEWLNFWHPNVASSGIQVPGEHLVTLFPDLKPGGLRWSQYLAVSSMVANPANDAEDAAVRAFRAFWEPFAPHCHAFMYPKDQRSSWVLERVYGIPAEEVTPLTDLPAIPMSVPVCWTVQTLRESTLKVDLAVGPRNTGYKRGTHANNVIWLGLNASAFFAYSDWEVESGMRDADAHGTVLAPFTRLAEQAAIRFPVLEGFAF